jgi:hypothetical protein
MKLGQPTALRVLEPDAPQAPPLAPDGPELGAGSQEPSSDAPAAPGANAGASRAIPVSFGMWFGSLGLPRHHAAALRAIASTSGMLPPVLWAKRFSGYGR